MCVDLLAVLLVRVQVANAQDERDEAVKARDAAVRERDSTLHKVGLHAPR